MSSSTPVVKRHHSMIDPNSPEHVPSENEKAFRILFEEYMSPLNVDITEIKSFIQETTGKISLITDLQNELKAMKKDFDEVKERVTALETLVSSQTETIVSLEGCCEDNDLKTAELQSQNKKLHNDALYAECYSRRENLQFHGIPERRYEDVEAIIAQVCKDARLDLPRYSFVRVHRLGEYRRNQTRPVIARFHHFKDREVVWRSRKVIKAQQNVGISEDFHPEILARRKELYPILDAAYNYYNPEHPELKYLGKIVLDKLILNGKVYTVDTLCNLPIHLQPEKVASPSNDKTMLFFTKASPLSNHYLCNFEVNGTRYNCMEQYLMTSKARHFDDTDTVVQIMKTKNPGQQKGLGKRVADFDLEKWRKVVPQILLMGVRAKFTQDRHCQSFLKETKEKVLGEANPNDTYYGIGMGAKDRNAWDMDKWGHNLLGKTLMDVRSDLK